MESPYLQILFFASCVLSTSCTLFTTVEEIKKSFKSRNCIKGALTTFSLKSPETYLLEEGTSNIYSENNSSVEYTYEKSAMSKIHELAQYNSIKYFYKLEKEEGPPHNKLFTVSLKLGDEEYLSEGTTLKKTQQNVAHIALENTDYELPPSKEKESNKEALTPTVLLNNLAAKLGLKVTYYLIDKDKQGLLNTKNVVDGQLKKSYMQKLNESLYSDNDLHVRKEESQSKGPFKILVEVDDRSFYGYSYTVQAARHEAATKAVDYLIQQIQDGNSVCLKEDSKECKQAKANIKSPISLVYEAAQLRNLDVEFEIVKEEGPSHQKVFVTQCRLGHLSTTGEGKSKKDSKRIAATNMLERMSELPKVPQEVLTRSLLKDKQGKKNKKKNKILKTTFDMINMHIDNLIETVLESGTSDTKSESSTEIHKKSGAIKNSKQKPFKKSYQGELLEVSNLLNFEVQYMDVKDVDQHISLISLHINPSHICFGQGSSTKIARDRAARESLKLLHDIPFDSYFVDKKYIEIRSEIKERIQGLLNQEISENQ